MGGYFTCSPGCLGSSGGNDEDWAGLVSGANRRADRVLVVVPVYGHQQMTHDLVADLERESDLADVVIVDNRGDYLPSGQETVVQPGSNLGWAGGTNYGTRECRRADHAGFVWLNNDTRLSSGFVTGLLDCWRATGAGIVGPSYDCHWMHQRPAKPVSVGQYRARKLHFRAPFIDGTCLFVPAATIETVGVLDADTFGPIGWGAEIDYGLRARAAGLELAITRLAYLHHEKSVTGTTAFAGGLVEYATRGHPVMIDGLRQKWGEEWPLLAGIDLPTWQTSALQRKDRLRSSRGRIRSRMKRALSPGFLSP